MQEFRAEPRKPGRVRFVRLSLCVPALLVLVYKFQICRRAAAVRHVRDCVHAMEAGTAASDSAAYPSASTDRVLSASSHNYVEYRPGSGAWPVVLAAPHGGMLMPEAVPDRSSGVTEPDWKSYELATAIFEAFRDAGAEAGAPALVSLMLDRRKMDGNRCRAQCCDPVTDITGLGRGAREQIDASQGAPSAWDTYHGCLSEALATAVERHGFCLLLDVHGQSHRTGVTELGYLLTSQDLLLPDEAIDANQPRQSSIDSLLHISRDDSPTSRRSLAGLVRGRESLGAFLEARGFPCVPSPATPHPVKKEALRAAQASKADIVAAKGPPPEAVAEATYFWGAYSIRRYGASGTVPADMHPLSDAERSTWASKVAAVQLETSWEGVRESAGTRCGFGRALSEVRRMTTFADLCSCADRCQFAQTRQPLTKVAECCISMMEQATQEFLLASTGWSLAA